MPRRSNKSSSHVHRVQTTTTMTFTTTTSDGRNGTTTTMTNSNNKNNGYVDMQGRDMLYHKHQLLRRATSFMLSCKYRAPWHYHPNEYTNGNPSTRTKTRPSSSSTGRDYPPILSNEQTRVTSNVTVRKNSKTHIRSTRDELVNFWKDLPPVGKRALLRIHRDVYLVALDHYLVRHHLCCECHDNVIAEWEDHERRRSSNRALQDIFSIFPPYLDDEEDEEYDEGDDEEDDEECFDDGVEDTCGHLVNRDEVFIDDEDLVLKYDLYQHNSRRAAVEAAGVSAAALGSSHCVEHHSYSPHPHDSNMKMMSDEYIVDFEVGKRQEDELLRMIQKEERYIIIREDHTEFIMDLIRCGEQFSYVSSTSEPISGSVNEYEEYDEDDDVECPGANTSYLAQEYLLEVLAIKFREQLENAYQEALQHSLAVQAELLRDEIAALQQQNGKTATSSKKKKDKKKKKKKAEASRTTLNTSTSPSGKENNKKNDLNTKMDMNPVKLEPTSLKMTAHGDTCEVEDDEGQEVDREVEQFRLLLEKINTNHTPRSKPKLVLPPGAFTLP